MNANAPLRTKPRSVAGNGSPKVVGVAAAEIDFPASHSIARLVRQVYRVFNKAMQIRLDRHGVTLGQWAFLRALWEQDGQTQRELATELGLKESTAMFSLNS